MTKVTVSNPTSGVVGFLHNIEKKSDSILVFQLPRATKMLNEEYVASAMKSVRDILPDNTKAIVIGADVNIYEIAGEEATALILKGIIS